MAGNLREFQFTTSIKREHLSTDNHLYNIFKKNPFYAQRAIDFIFRQNFRNILSSELANVTYFDSEAKTYFWKRGIDAFLSGKLVGAWQESAGVTNLTDVEYPLQGDTIGYIDIKGFRFGVDMVIATTDTYDRYQLWIQDAGTLIAEDTYRYAAKLLGPSSLWIPKSELALNKDWFFRHALAADRYSDRGSSYDQAFTTFDMRGDATQFRFARDFELDFYVNAKKALKEGDAMRFAFLDPETKQPVVSWLDTVTMQFLKMAKDAENDVYKYGISNINMDGSVNNKAHNGQNATSTAGIEHYYLQGNNELFDIDNFNIRTVLTSYIQENLGKIDVENSELVFSAGTAGYFMLQKSAVKEFGLSGLDFMKNTNSPAYTWQSDSNKVFIKEGQIEGFQSQLGITVKFVIDKTKDDIYMNTKTHNGALTKAHEIDIMLKTDIKAEVKGKNQMVNNIQKVRVNGFPPSFGVQPGMGFNWGGMTQPMSGISANFITQPTTASTLHYMWTGGLVVWRPEYLKRLSPTELYV
jgi:hypothetical protein